MKNRGLLAILALALILRLALLWAAYEPTKHCEFQRGIFAPDSLGYLFLAHSLVQNGEFTQDSQPEVFRTPGYPCFLSTMMLLWPDRQGLNLAAALVVQILLDCLLVLLTYLLGKELLSRRLGLWAALLQAISPLAIAYSCRILSDSLFALLITAALCAAVRYFKLIRVGVVDRAILKSAKDRAPERQKDLAGDAAPGTEPPKEPSHEGAQDAPIVSSAHEHGGRQRPPCHPANWPKWLIACALLLALACYVRPIGIAISAAFIAVVLVYQWQVRRAVLMAGVIALCLLPWVARNWSAAGYAGFSDVTGRGLLDYTAAQTLAEAKSVSRQQAVEILYADAPDETHSAGEMNAFRMRKVREVFARYPMRFVKVQLVGDFAFWLPGAADVLEVAGLTTGQRGTLKVLHEQGLLPAIANYFGGNVGAIVLSIPLCLIDLARLVGMLLLVIFSIRTKWSAEVWLMILLVGISFLMPGPASHPRFRLAVEPILSIAAAAGCLLLLERRKTS